MSMRRFIIGFAGLLATATTAEFDRERYLTHAWYEIEVIVFDRPLPEQVLYGQSDASGEPHYAPKRHVDAFRLPRRAVSFVLSDEAMRGRLHGMAEEELWYPIVDIPTAFPDWLWSADDFVRLREAAAEPEPMDALLSETGEFIEEGAPLSTAPGQDVGEELPSEDALDPSAAQALPSPFDASTPILEVPTAATSSMVESPDELPIEQEPPIELPPTDEELLIEAVTLFEEDLMARHLQPTDKMVRLEGTWRAMNRRYGVLRAWRWLQDAPERDAPVPILINAGLDDGGLLAGSIAVTVGRFLHFHAHLARFDGQGSAAIISERRRMRIAEVHYLDNPAFGILVRIDPVPVTQELEILAKRFEMFSEQGQ